MFYYNASVIAGIAVLFVVTQSAWSFLLILAWDLPKANKKESEE